MRDSSRCCSARVVNQRGRSDRSESSSDQSLSMYRRTPDFTFTKRVSIPFERAAIRGLPENRIDSRGRGGHVAKPRHNGAPRPAASRLPANNRTVNSSFIRSRIGECIRMQMRAVINGRVAGRRARRLAYMS